MSWCVSCKLKARSAFVNFPNIFCCGNVCGAPLYCNSCGRSVDKIISGTSDTDASATAGVYSVIAVPEVPSRTTGDNVVLAIPSAKKPADRSSTST